MGYFGEIFLKISLENDLHRKTYIIGKKDFTKDLHYRQTEAIFKNNIYRAIFLLKMFEWML